MENYTVFVRLLLQNELSKGLILASSQFSSLNKQADIFQAKLNSIKTLGLIGGGLLFGGIIGLRVADSSLKYAEEYAHQLNILNMAGLTQKQIAEAVGTAWKNTHDIITVSATKSLAMWNDLRIVFGLPEEATKALPFVSRMQGILMASKEGRAAASDKDFAFSVAKALDIIGAVKNKEEFEKQATMMTSDIAAFQGRVQPKMFQSTFAYARQAKYAMSDEFKYEILPTLMMEYALSGNSAGGGSRGVGPMIAATYRFTNQGFVNKAALPEIESLGLLGDGGNNLTNKNYDEDIYNNGKYLKTTTSGTTLLHGLKDYQLAGSNPFLWVLKDLVPALQKKYGNNLTTAELQSHITAITRGNQLAGNLLTEFAVKSYAFLRDQKLVQQAMQKTPDELFTIALLHDPGLAHEALSQQWNNLMTSISQPMIAILIPALTMTASLFNKLSEVLMKYPFLAKTLAYSFVGLSAAMAFGGTVILLTAAFKLLWATLAFIPPLLSITTTVFRGMLYSLLVLNAPIIGTIAAISLLGFGVYKLGKLLGIDWGALFSVIVSGLKSIFSFLINTVSKIINFVSGTPGKDSKSHLFFNSNDVNKKNSSNLLYRKENSASNKPIYLIDPKDTMKKGTVQAIQVNSATYLDGRKIADTVTNHIVNSANSVPNNTARFDQGMNPTPVLLKLGTY
jgi:hypothetical protein